MLFESITPVQWWLIAGILLFVFEIFTPGFFLACFGMGAFAAIIPAALGLSIVWQTVFFIVASLLALPAQTFYAEEGAEGSAACVHRSGCPCRAESAGDGNHRSDDGQRARGCGWRCLDGSLSDRGGDRKGYACGNRILRKHCPECSGSW